MVSYKIYTSFAAVVLASVMAVAVFGEISPGPRKVYQAAGLIVNLTSDLKKCPKVQCVSGTNCTAESNMKCDKFTYCGELVPNSTDSSSVIESSSIVLGDACLPGLALGKACTNNTDCLDYWSGAYCSPDTHVCTRARVLNESCTADAPCVFPLDCEDGFCVDRFVLTAGDVCDKSLENGGCHYSLFCDNTTNMCKELPVEGEECRDDVGCAVPFFCSPRSGKCLAAMSRPEFESCVTALDCEEGLVCARNKTCITPSDNYTQTPKCSKNEDCPQTSYCHCDYVTGENRCLPLPISSESTLDAFNKLVGCISLDPDLSVARCQTELVNAQRAANASAIIDFECSRLPAVVTSIDLVLLLVPVAILVMILILVVIVKLGIPKDK